MSDSANEDRDSFGAIASVAHELRTPLTAIQGAVEVLRDEAAGELTPAQREFIDLAHRNLERLKNRIEDALDIAELPELDRQTIGPLHLPSITDNIAARAAVESGPDLRIVFEGFDREIDVAISQSALCRTLASIAATVARHSSTCDVRIKLSVVVDELVFEISNIGAPGKGVECVTIHEASLAMAQEVVSQHGGTLQVAERSHWGVYVQLPIQPISHQRER